MNRVIEKKRVFTEKLSELLNEMDPDIKGVEYRCFPDKYSEMVRITYPETERIWSK